jgi:predicted nucleotidyltransferase
MDMSEIDIKKTRLLSALKSYFKHKAEIYNIDMAFLYGSWATGYPKIDSDVDIAVVFNKEKGRDELFDIITTLSLELTNVLKTEANVLYIDEEFSKPMLYYNAIVHGIPVFIGSFTRYVDKRLYAIYQMEDFSIFGKKWQSEIVQKRLERLNNA